MTYEWREHTAELELVVEAESERDVFAEAARAFGELVDRGEGGDPTAHVVAVEARDLGSLLVDWLEELIFLADTQSFVPERVPSLELECGRLRALVEGRRAALAPLVKAATYHGLHFSRADASWRAQVVLDV